MEGLLVVLSIVSIIGVFVLLFVIAERKRTESLGKAAESMGLTFYPKGDQKLLSDLRCFRLFSKGSGKNIANMLSGEADGTQMGVFDYTYRTGGGKNSSTWRQTVVYFESIELSLPDFAMAPENVFHRIASSFGIQDIDFATHPVFSSAYLLGGSDEEAIRKAFSAEVLRFFEEHQGWNIEAAGHRLIVFQANQRTSPENLKSFMADAFKVLTVLRDCVGVESEKTPKS